MSVGWAILSTIRALHVLVATTIQGWNLIKEITVSAFDNFPEPMHLLSAYTWVNRLYAKFIGI